MYRMEETPLLPKARELFEGNTRRYLSGSPLESSIHPSVTCTAVYSTVLVFQMVTKWILGWRRTRPGTVLETINK